MQAATLYANHVRTAVNQLESDAQCVNECKRLTSSHAIQANLTHFAFLPKCIEWLKKQGLSLLEAFTVLDEVQEKLASIPGEAGEKVRAKLNGVSARNPALEEMEKISTVLHDTARSLPLNIEPADVALFKYCPMSCADDVEPPFSMYKAVLQDCEMRLTVDNIHKILITKCFHNCNNVQK